MTHEDIILYLRLICIYQLEATEAHPQRSGCGEQMKAQVLMDTFTVVQFM